MRDLIKHFTQLEEIELAATVGGSPELVDCIQAYEASLRDVVNEERLRWKSVIEQALEEAPLDNDFLA